MPRVAWFYVLRVSPFAKPMPGSQTIVANCGHRSWIAPTGRRWLAIDPVGRGAYVLCTDCMEPGALTDRKRDRVAVPGAQDELRDRLGVAEGDQVAAFVRNLGVRWS